MSKKKQTKTNKDSEVLEDELKAAEITADEMTEENSVIEETVDELEALQNEITKLQDNFLRERAELENFKRRSKQEYETNLKFANQSLIEKFLPILDGFDRALAGVDQSDESIQQFLKGFEMIKTLLDQVLENEGVKVIETVNAEFDPYLHQAVLQESDEAKENNIILAELQKGYTYKDRVLRASMVKVNTK